MKLAEERGAAQVSTALAEAADHLRLVADAHLAQIDASIEVLGQVFHQPRKSTRLSDTNSTVKRRPLYP